MAAAASFEYAGIDNAALVARSIEDEDLRILSNGDVFPFPGQEVLLTLARSADKGAPTATLKGPVRTPGRLAPRRAGGKDFVFDVLLAHDPLPDAAEPEMPGCFKGSVRFSKFRWVLASLEPCPQAEYDAAAEQAKRDYAELEALAAPQFQDIVAAADELAPEQAIQQLTRALFVCDEEDLRSQLSIFHRRARCSYELGAYAAAVRDVEYVQRMCGDPLEAIQDLDDDLAPKYYETVILLARAQTRLGELEDAANNYKAVRIANKLATEAGAESLVPDALVDEAEAALAKWPRDPDTATVFTIKVTLDGVEPEITRTLDIMGENSLAEVREYLVASMGWMGNLLHEFVCWDHGPVRFCTIEDEVLQEWPDAEMYEDDEFTRLKDVLSAKGDRIALVYDIEAEKWPHTIELVAVRDEAVPDETALAERGEEFPPDKIFPRCLAGARACPPEKIGGVDGFKQFLAFISGKVGEHPKFKSVAEATEFAKANTAVDNNPAEAKVWDAEYFDLDKTNAGLMELVSLFESYDFDDDEDEEDEGELENDEAYIEDGGL